MEASGDPITMLLTTGGGGVGGGALTAYLLMKLTRNGNGNGDNSVSQEMHMVGEKLDRTNELLNELLRSHARLEGLLQHDRR